MVVMFFGVVTAAQADRAVKRVVKPIAGQYIVTLNPAFSENPDAVLADLADKFKVRLRGSLLPAVNGGHFEMNDGLAQAMLHDARVENVWEDGEVDFASTVTPRSWNIDRIDNRLSPRMDALYSYCTTGRGVRAYVVDTGIWAGHDEFSNADPITGGTRVPLGFDIDTYFGYSQTNRSNNPPCNRTSTDEKILYGGSHGTAVASVLGGRTMGVAPEVTLVPVRVFKCDSSGGLNAIYGLNWIANEVVPAGTRRVVNMSFTMTLANPADLTPHPLEQAIDTLIAKGITVVAAAGNDNTTTANYTPARYEPVIVVGGSKGASPTDLDSRWNDGPLGNPGSNYGTSIDLSAPADRVLVAQWTDAYATRPINDNRWSSGTSYSAPMVAGAIARNLQLYDENHQLSAARVIGEATTEAHGLNLLDRQASPNRLLFMYTDCVKRRPSGS